MKPSMRKSLFLAASIVPLLFAVTKAVAQGQSQGEGNNSRILDTIVVTAEKREENLQDVPISITAFSGAATREFGFTDSTDIAGQVPGLNIGTPVGEGNNPSITLRGVGLNDFNDNNEGPVSVYNDGVYVAALPAQTFQLFDLERVEVLRGPQGTLFGRNATGGLIQFVAAKPTEEFEAFSSVTIGNFSTVKTESAVSGPLSDYVRGRLSVATNNSDGYVTNNLGPDGNESDNVSVRTQLDFDIGNRGSFLIRGDYNESDVAAPRFEHEATGSIFNEVFPNAPLLDQFGFAELDGDPFTVTQDRDGNVLAIENYGISGTFDYALTDNISFTSITAYSEVDRLYEEDTDLGPFPAIVPNFNSTIDQFSQELRFSGEHGRFRWQGGFYYFSADVDAQLENEVAQTIEFVDFLDDLPGADGGFEGGLSALLNGGTPFIDGGLFDFTGATFAAPSLNPFNVNPALATVPINGQFLPFLEFDVDYLQETESFAFFYQGDFDLTDKLTLTAGIRYTNEDREIEYLNAAPTGSLLNDFFAIPGLGDPTAGTGSLFETFGSTAGNYFDFTDAGLTARGLDAELNNISNDAVTGRAVLEYKASDDLLVYASYNRGFKSAGFNAGFLDSSDGVSVDNVVYDEETINAYEAGFKSTLANGRFRLNASAFYYDYDDFQALTFLGLSQFITNADATFYGGEIEASASPIDGLDLSLSASFLDTDVDGVEDLNSGSTIDNVEAVLAPNFSLNGFIRYEQPAFGGIVSGLLDFNYQGSQFFDITNSPVSEENGYTVVNLRLAYKGGENENYEFAFFVNNLGDEEYRVYTFDFSSIAGFNQQFFGPPRTFGGSLTYNF